MRSWQKSLLSPFKMMLFKLTLRRNLHLFLHFRIHFSVPYIHSIASTRKDSSQLPENLFRESPGRTSRSELRTHFLPSCCLACMSSSFPSGADGRRRWIDLSGAGAQEQADRHQLLRKARAEREQRQLANKQTRAENFLKSRLRGRLQGFRERQQLREGWDASLERQGLSGVDVVWLLRVFLQFFSHRAPADRSRLERMVKLLVSRFLRVLWIDSFRE